MQNSLQLKFLFAAIASGRLLAQGCGLAVFIKADFKTGFAQRCLLAVSKGNVECGSSTVEGEAAPQHR
jgi:hypothetical protein